MFWIGFFYCDDKTSWPEAAGNGRVSSIAVFSSSSEEKKTGTLRQDWCRDQGGMLFTDLLAEALFILYFLASRMPSLGVALPKWTAPSQIICQMRNDNTVFPIGLSSSQKRRYLTFLDKIVWLNWTKHFSVGL